MKKLKIDKLFLQDYLEDCRWLLKDEKVTDTESPGEGNMNFTLRIKTNKRSVIIKQSREYVEKYPQVNAPKERALMEAGFYKLISGKQKLASQMPRIIGVDEENSVLLMKDLGKGNDFTYIYEKGKGIEEAELFQIMDFVALLHNSFDASDQKNPIRNRAMRKLNHEHIFIYPFIENNGSKLDEVLPGLAESVKPLIKDLPLKSKIKNLGESYLADGKKLLHGDYFPGSWLKTGDGIKIIDPEFCFFGAPEFEIGVIKAHLKMANQSKGLIDKAIGYYRSKAELNEAIMNQYCAIEILRRIMGLAQLPLKIDLEKRVALINESVSIIKANA